jgi:hypothetical protein
VEHREIFPSVKPPREKDRAWRRQACCRRRAASAAGISGAGTFCRKGSEILALLPAARALGSALIGAVRVYLRDEDAPQPRSLRGIFR